MLDIASFRSDLAEVIDDLPVACTMRGQAFTATSSDDGETREVEIDGTIMEVDRIIVADIADLPPDPQSGEKVTVGGKEYRIMTAAVHQDGVGVELRLKAVAK